MVFLTILELTVEEMVFNIQGIGKVDNNFGVIFFWQVFLIQLIKEENFESSNLFNISNFVLFQSN